MKTKNKLVLIVAVIAALVLAGFFLKPSTRERRSASEEKSEQLYVCGMHPQVIQNKPGNCPICGMKLTAVRKQPGADAGTMVIDPVTIQNMNIRTSAVVRGPLRRTIRTVAIIDYNEPSLVEVTTKFKGWIEELYVDATGQQVHRGEPLFEIYSPELYSAEVEYLIATAAPGDRFLEDPGLKSSALTKLKYFDISDEQIAALEKTRQPMKTMRILSPSDGFVIDKMVVTGQMVDEGMKIYGLADLSLVWVYAQIYEQDIAYIKLGQEAIMTIPYLPGRQFRGRVTYIYPTVDEKTRTVRVRMEFHNPGYFLKPGMFASVAITSELEPAVILVPDSAVLRSGERNTVFVALEGGRFDPRTVMLGPPAENDQYQVISGLKEGENVVISGQFMLDSESQLREAIQKMLSPGKVAPPTGPEPPKEHGVPTTPLAPEKLVYICPMPEHSAVRVDQPGKCPKCGMTLIPVMEAPKQPPAETAKKPEALPEKLYVCPMPEHADVVSDKPGKCPKCEMTLVETSKVPHGKDAEDAWHKKHPAAVHPAGKPQDHN